MKRFFCALILVLLFTGCISIPDKQDAEILYDFGVETIDKNSFLLWYTTFETELQKACIAYKINDSDVDIVEGLFVSQYDCWAWTFIGMEWGDVVYFQFIIELPNGSEYESAEIYRYDFNREKGAKN